MNWRRIVAIILGIAALLSILSQLGIFSAAGLSEYPFWLIWPLTIFGMIGAIMLWFWGARENSASASTYTVAGGAVVGGGVGAVAGAATGAATGAAELAERDAQIAALEARLATAQMAAEDTGDTSALEAENAALKAEVASLKDEIGETAQTMHATERVEFRGKSQTDLNTMFGGDFVDGAMARHFHIDYVDSKGQPSEREILVYALVHRKGNLNLDSFPTDGYSCLTFRADRIQKLKDLQTGEVVSDDIGDWIVTTSKERAAN
jgi:hypothetical protein